MVGDAGDTSIPRRIIYPLVWGTRHPSRDQEVPPDQRICIGNPASTRMKASSSIGHHGDVARQDHLRWPHPSTKRAIADHVMGPRS